jgi:hypothetical protein
MENKEYRMSDQIVPKFTLHSLVQQAQAIEAAIVEVGGELSPELEKLLENLDLTIAEKLDGYSFIMDRFENEAAFFRTKADTFARVSKGLLLFQDKLKERVKLAMVAMGKDEVKGNEVRFKLSNSAPKLVIENESMLPAAYQKIVQTVVPDKEKIREDLSIGLSVEGCKLVNGKSLRSYINKKGE